MDFVRHNYSDPSNTIIHGTPEEITISDDDTETIPKISVERKRTNKSFSARRKKWRKRDKHFNDGFRLNEHISNIVKTQIQKTFNDSKKLVDVDEWQNVKLKLDQLEKQNLELQKEITLLHSKLENSFILPSNPQLINGVIVGVTNEMDQTFSNDIIVENNEQTVNTDNTETDDNFVVVKEPSWMVEKEKCQSLLEKAQNQIPLFLPLFIPEIFNAAEIISHISFPEAATKIEEVQSIIHYFWKDQSTPDFYAKLIEKEFQNQRYKVTRKLYYCLKFSSTCTMRKDGKVFDYKCERVTPKIMSYNNENYEWFIPEELIFDDYIIGAMKNPNNETHIYKLDLVSNLMTLLHTKRK